MTYYGARDYSQVACSVRVPTEVIKQRVQARQFPNTISAFRGTIRQSGILGLYCGYLSTVLREVRFNARPDWRRDFLLIQR
jgi:hypothetical protein